MSPSSANNRNITRKILKSKLTNLTVFSTSNGFYTLTGSMRKVLSENHNALRKDLAQGLMSYEIILLKRPYISLIIGTRGSKCENNLQKVMAWEPFPNVKFDL